jgi:voltage-gated potassium channel
MSGEQTRNELKSTGYEIFIALLSILSIVNLVLLHLVRDDNLKQVLVVMNVLLSVVFLIDFTYRFATAPSRSRYFFRGFGWADLLASLPLPEAKFLRIFRLVRVVRLLRGMGGRAVVRGLVRERAGSALLTLLLMGILVLQFGSLAILRVEQGDPEANITSASDAIWYTIVTISTVGYGDQYPVTARGRLLGAGIIVVGVGIFGTFTGYLANAFLTPRKGTGGTGAPEAPPEDAAEPTTAPATDALDDLRALVAEPGASLDDVQRWLTANPASPDRWAG